MSSSSLAGGRKLPYKGPKPGLMQHHGLLISSILDHAERLHYSQEIVSRLFEEGNVIHRTTYGEVAKRAKKLANALKAEFDVRAGDVVGTLASNSFRHLEMYYGVSGIGAVLHTLNPRYSVEQLEYIITHGEDRIIFTDIAFLPILKTVLSRGACTNVERIVIFSSEKFMPKDSKALNALCYETLIGRHSDQLTWPIFDENYASSLCYTSGTTGHPKGVLYSHRSSILHALCQATHEGNAINNRDSILVIVPMFHVQAWGIPYVGAMTGAKLILPGTQLDGEHLCEFLTKENDVTLMLGVPTVWQNVFEYLDHHPDKKRQVDWTKIRIVIGGSAPPRSMLKRIMHMNSTPVHAWGMTETSPLGTVCMLMRKHDALTEDDQLDVLQTQGRTPFGVQVEIFDDNNNPLPHDGKSTGNLLARGVWVTRQYVGEPSPNTTGNSWFNTGDVAAIDADGFVRITDRSKDVIKSGGEWISSIDLENVACAHPSVSAAAVIGVKHHQWQERPLLLIVRKKGAQHEKLTSEDVLKLMRSQFPRWWTPDAVEFVESLPLTATGKISKLQLRKQYAHYVLKEEVEALKEEERESARAPVKLPAKL